MLTAIIRHIKAGIFGRSARIFSFTAIVVLMITTDLQAAADALSNNHDDGMAITLIIALMISLTVGAALIIGLVFWGRKQDHIGEMMLFCMKFLLRSDDVTERCASARALGESRDDGALLVLVDIIADEEEPEEVHKAAREALHQMSELSRKHLDVFAELEMNIELQDTEGIINTVIERFEQGNKKYAQSAYTIGRHYIRLGHFVEAREWLTKADIRNRKFNLYGDRIDYWIGICNRNLLAEADASYDAADYYQAKEHYAVLDHGLNDEEKRQCAIYLRTTCVYCKLKDYINADQALLQALENNHQTDYALELVPLLRQLLNPADDRQGKLNEVETKLDTLSSDIMLKIKKTFVGPADPIPTGSATPVGQELSS
ncbi:MAG: hypothetical protein ABW176_17965 [Candidatus Thiodiazotropha endolucinida]